MLGKISYNIHFSCVLNVLSCLICCPVAPKSNILVWNQEANHDHSFLFLFLNDCDYQLLQI
jgi:hypothetical protein